MQDELDQKRVHINQIDEQLVALLSERARTALEIGKLKEQLGVKPYDPARERIVLEHIGAMNQGPLDKGALEDIFAAIITACREIQSR